MRNYIRTAFGDSTRYFCGTEDDLLQGGGQGNPAAPPMWTAISIIILRILHEYEAGVEIFSSITLIATLFSAIMYVDDTDIFLFGRSDESLLKLIDRSQSMAMSWCNSF